MSNQVPSWWLTEARTVLFNSGNWCSNHTNGCCSKTALLIFICDKQILLIIGLFQTHQHCLYLYDQICLCKKNKTKKN